MNKVLINWISFANLSLFKYLGIFIFTYLNKKGIVRFAGSILLQFSRKSVFFIIIFSLQQLQVGRFLASATLVNLCFKKAEAEREQTFSLKVGKKNSLQPEIKIDEKLLRVYLLDLVVLICFHSTNNKGIFVESLCTYKLSNCLQVAIKERKEIALLKKCARWRWN